MIQVAGTVLAVAFVFGALQRLGVPPLVTLAVVIVLGVGYLVARVHRWLVSNWFLGVLFRFLTGVSASERTTRGKRAARRLGTVGAGVAVVAGFLAAPQVTVTALKAGGAVAVAAGLVVAFLWVRSLRHRRVWLRPLHKRLAPKVGVALTRPPQSWIKDAVPGVSVRLELPAGWTATARDEEEIKRIAALAVAIESPEASWHRAGPTPKLILTASAPPPARVALSDVRELLDRAKHDDLLWGLGKKKEPVDSSLSGDSPHAGLSMGSGSGKSATARALLSQMLYRGCVGLILDYKMISHQWAAGLPNVAIARRVHEIHAALLWLGAEVERRNEVALAGADIEGNVRAVVGPRLIVVAEELNATVARLRAYWREIRDPGDPVRSPALEALDSVSFMGRQVLTNVIYIGQRLSVKASGGDGDARENIGVIAFGRYSASNWKMLAPDHPMPPSSRKEGRIQVVTDRVRECQAVFMTAREARALATAGDVAQCPAGMPGAVRVADGTRTQIPGPDMPFVPETGPSVLTLPSRVTLSEAVREGIVSCSLHAIRKAAQRDHDFPGRAGMRGLAGEYDALALAEWDAGRR